MAQITLPRAKRVIEYGGYLKVAPRYALEGESLRETCRAASDLFDKVFGLELQAASGAAPDESLLTPLAEGGEERDAANSAAAEIGAASGDGFFVKYNAGLSKNEFKLRADRACLVEASGAEGLFRAFSFMAQASRRTCDGYIEIPKCLVEDEPDCDFRGFLLDAARRYHPVSQLYEYVDLCSLIGINRFVIHFTDDENYTLPSKAFPRLTTEAVHYTEEEIRALGAYASSRGVMIIPEIDMPGHSAQFQLKYPEIFGKCGIMDATEEVFSALGEIYREAAELFPDSEYIHIGGDEAVLGRWLDSEATKEYMSSHGIADICELYGHFVGKVADDVISIGKIPIAWEGFGKASNGAVPRGLLVASFENHYQTASELVDAGFTIINASWRPLYCVAPWQKWSKEEILSSSKYVFDHWWEESKAYNKGVSVPVDSPVAGSMLCAWGDYLKNYASSRLACRLEWATVYPRLSALAENLWNSEHCPEEEFAVSFARLEEVLSLVRGDHPFRGRL